MPFKSFPIVMYLRELMPPRERQKCIQVHYVPSSELVNVNAIAQYGPGAHQLRVGPWGGPLEELAGAIILNGTSIVSHWILLMNLM